MHLLRTQNKSNLIAAKSCYEIASLMNANCQVHSDLWFKAPIVNFDIVWKLNYIWNCYGKVRQYIQYDRTGGYLTTMEARLTTVLRLI